MDSAKIVHATKQENGVGDGLFSARQVMHPTDKWGKIGTERTIQALTKPPSPKGEGFAEATESGDSD